MAKTILLASAPDSAGLRGLIAQYYYTDPERVILGDSGAIFLGEKQLGTKWEKRRGRLRFLMICKQ